jgi:hypothetical protein
MDYEPEGDQINENPLVGLGIRAGMAAGTALAGKAVYDKAKGVADKVKERNAKMQQQINQLNQSYEPEGEVLDERRKEDKVAGTPRKPRNPAFELVAKSMGAGRLGVQPRGKKKEPGKKPPVAGQYGGPASPAQKVAARRASAQRAQDMMHSRFD